MKNTSIQSTEHIPADELRALEQCHNRFGKAAKRRIRDAWFNGDYSHFYGIDYSALQRFRNAEHGGPEGLCKLSLSNLTIMKNTIAKINRQASTIAGALWDDRSKEGTLAEQLRRVASEPSHGTDGDLTDSDRASLRDLATQAEAV